MTLVAVGDNCLDVYFQTDETFVGGNALNVAVNWARAGLDARYVGAVGDDPAAPLIRAAVIDQGLAATDLDELRGPTGVTLIALDGAERRFVYEEFGVGALWQPPAETIAGISAADWVHLAGVQRSAGLVSELKARGATVSVDLSTFGDVDHIVGVDIAFASSPDSLDEATELGERIVAAGAAMAVVTAGAAGSVAVTSDRRVRRSADAVDVVDTCGAGDSYIAGVIAASSAGANLDEAMRAGTAAASRTCGHRAGFPQQPSTTLSWIVNTYYPHARAADPIQEAER